MTRRTLLLLTPLLLAGCIKASASYTIGSGQTLTVRAEQAYFWNDAVTLELVAARLPECQRRHALATVPASEIELALYASGDNTYTLRAGKQAWQVETQSCTQTAAPAPDAAAERLGTFRLDADKKLVFEKAGTA